MFMKTKILKSSEVDKAAKIIKSDGIVAFPTETIYGLGANGLNDFAVRKIFIAKGRPQDNPLILHVSSIDQVRALVTEIPVKARKLMNAFWPGPLTIVMNKSNIVPSSVCGLKTVAIRMPKNDIALELITKSGCPIAAPSANTSGKPSPTIAMHVIDDLDGKIDAVIDGGSTEIGIESTVIDLTEKPLILRPGMITKKQIESVIGKISSVTVINEQRVVPKSPGMKYKHYSPKAEVIFFDCSDYYSKIRRYIHVNHTTLSNA
jgi:L-threonylcarbamoyladenylate synthase